MPGDERPGAPGPDPRPGAGPRPDAELTAVWVNDVAVMSLEWNVGPGWDAEFYDAYGVAPDPVRLTFCRDLWNAT